MAFKYQVLGQQVIDGISNGSLKAGDSLPALRKFASIHNVSMTTANQAYSWLEQQGLIYVKPQSGYYIKSRDAIPSFSAPAVNALEASEDRSDQTLEILQKAIANDDIGLSNGFLDESFRPILALQRAMNRNARRNNPLKHSYGNSQGDPSLRAAIAEQMQNRHCPVAPENILVTNGCLEAIVLVMEEYTNVGDVVAVFSPCYNGLLSCLKNAGRKVLEIPCGPQGPDLDYLESLFKKKAFAALLFSATAYNPIGFTLAQEQKQRLAQMGAKYKTWLIEDDTFGSLNYLDENPSPVFTYDQSGYVIYCSSFSKDIAPEFRIGWIAVKQSIQALAKRKMALNISCAMPCQLAMADYLFSASFASQIKKVRGRIQTEMRLLRESVQAHFPEGTTMSSPQGGFFLWVQLPEKLSAMDLYMKAKEERIYFMPGELFTMTSLYKNNLRLSANKEWSEKRQQAIQWLGACAKEMLKG